MADLRFLRAVLSGVQMHHRDRGPGRLTCNAEMAIPSSFVADLLSGQIGSSRLRTV